MFSQKIKEQIMPVNNRTQVCIKLDALKQKIEGIKASCQGHEYDNQELPLVLGDLVARLDTVIENFQEIETMLRPVERERQPTKFKASKGKTLLTIDIYNDLVERLTVAEIIKKYSIKSAMTFYNHLKVSSLKDVDIVKLKKDKRYQAKILSQLSKDGKDKEPF